MLLLQSLDPFGAVGLLGTTTACLVLVRHLPAQESWHRSGADVQVTLSLPVSLALRLPRCREVPSLHRRLCGFVAPSAAQLACVGAVVRTAVGGAGCDTQSCRRSCGPAPRASSCVCSPKGHSHFGAVGLHIVQKQRLHVLYFQRHQTPWALLTVQHSNSCCALLSSRPSRSASGSSWGTSREAGVRGGTAGGGAGGVPGHGGALSVGSQMSVEDPGAVTCESSTCMLVCKSSRQSALRRKGSICGAVRFVHVFRHAKTPASCKYPVVLRKYGLPHKQVPSSGGDVRRHPSGALFGPSPENPSVESHCFGILTW